MILCPIAYWKKHCPDAFAFPTLTYRQFDVLIQKVTYFLKDVPHPVISFTPQKRPVDIAIFFAAWRLGKIVYPLNPKLPKKAIQARIQKTKSAWIEPERIFLSLSDETSWIGPDALATYIETSSATKIACHTLQSHFISAEKVNAVLGLTKEKTYCLNLPLFHVGGIAIFLRCFLAGAQIVFPEDCSHATHISMVPTQLFRYLQNGWVFSHLECLLLGGAPISKKLYEWALKKNLPLFPTYGMTEAASMIIVKTQILSHMELRLAEDGEIFLRSPSLFSHYFGDKSRKPTDWFGTKDLGKMQNGIIEILGRKDRQFISGGENIQPEEIEQALLQLDHVVEAHVTPFADEEFGMRPQAKIYTDTFLSEENIKKELRAFLPSFKIPLSIEVHHSPIHPKLLKMSQND